MGVLQWGELCPCDGNEQGRAEEHPRKIQNDQQNECPGTYFVVPFQRPPVDCRKHPRWARLPVPSPDPAREKEIDSARDAQKQRDKSQYVYEYFTRKSEDLARVCLPDGGKQRNFVFIPVWSRQFQDGEPSLYPFGPSFVQMRTAQSVERVRDALDTHKTLMASWYPETFPTFVGLIPGIQAKQSCCIQLSVRILMHIKYFSVVAPLGKSRVPRGKVLKGAIGKPYPYIAVNQNTVLANLQATFDCAIVPVPVAVLFRQGVTADVCSRNQFPVVHDDACDRVVPQNKCQDQTRPSVHFFK